MDDMVVGVHKGRAGVPGEWRYRMGSGVTDLPKGRGRGAFHCRLILLSVGEVWGRQVCGGSLVVSRRDNDKEDAPRAPQPPTPATDRPRTRSSYHEQHFFANEIDIVK